MVRTKFIYLKSCLLMAALFVAGAAFNSAFAFDYDGPDDAALTSDSPAPSLVGQSSTGFALESPADSDFRFTLCPAAPQAGCAVPYSSEPGRPSLHVGYP